MAGRNKLERLESDSAKPNVFGSQRSTPERCSTWCYPALLENIRLGSKGLAGDKHSSLFSLSVSKEEKTFS